MATEVKVLQLTQAEQTKLSQLMASYPGANPGVVNGWFVQQAGQWYFLPQGIADNANVDQVAGVLALVEYVLGH